MLGGVVYRLDLVTPEITQAIHTDPAPLATISMPRPKRCARWQYHYQRCYRN